VRKSGTAALSKDGYSPGPRPREEFSADTARGPGTHRWPPRHPSVEGAAQKRGWRDDGGRLATRGLYGGETEREYRTEGI